MSNQHETSKTSMTTTSKKTVKKSKIKAQKKATAHRHNSKRIQRKQRVQFLKAFEQKLSIDMGGSAVVFQVGMTKEPDKKGIKNKSKGKQAWKAVKTQKKNKPTKEFVLTFQPPTFVLDQDLQPSTFQPLTFGLDQDLQPLTFHPPTFGRATPMNACSPCSM
jgi:hypothetical protein